MLLLTSGLPAGALAADDGRPLADAGLDQSATVGDTVYLDGGGSLDPDGEIRSYSWSIRTPSGDQITPADPEAVTTRFVPEEAGRYHVQLTVTGDDGQTQSDTLFVDVDRAAEENPGATPTANDPPTSTPAPTPTDTPESPPEAESTPAGGPPVGTSDPAPTGNQQPSGEISGPSSVTSGSRVTYTLDTADADGTVTDSWWLPTTLSTNRVSRSELNDRARTITVDGTPGTTAEIAAVVIDDDGATTTVTKEVKVRNTPPTASIKGDGAAVVNTTKEYRLTATDPDGEITSVSLGSGSSAVEATEPMPWSGPTASGEWGRSFRFTEIPEDDGTVTLEATVRDEHGGVTTVAKSVTVVGGSESKMANPVAQSPPDILSIDAYWIGESEAINDGQVRFSATARDNSSGRLTFTWKIGEQALLETAAGGDPARGNVSYVFDNGDFGDGEVRVTVTVTDQHGNKREGSTSVELHRTRSDGGTYGRSRPVEVTSTRGRTIYGKFQTHQNNLGKEIVITYGDDYRETVEITNPDEMRFSHQYEASGRYLIGVNPRWSGDVSTTLVDVGAMQYELYTYERKATTIHRTNAAESPGDNWTRKGVERIEREQTGTEKMQTLADGPTAVVSPGEEWKHVGTITEYHTERRTTESTESPGSDWSIAERNVDQKQVFDGWRHTTVPQRGLLGGDWNYVGAVQTTVERTETERSAYRPAGSGWSRDRRVGRTQTGYRTRWVDYRFHADADWQYVRSDRYVSGYETRTVCTEYIRLRYVRHCVDERTYRYPEYDYRYEYRVPEYDPVYEWERTVEETEYEYKYRTATYEMEAVHKYEREVRVGTEYAQWERPTYNETTIYRWTNTVETWEETKSFSKPIGEVRNVDRQLKECGAGRDTNEPPKCEGGGG
ncbi:PKD domain-containing protein [Halolamina salifodinae]|uniref:PKD domain-containing protein n=1 Tax=Halolamina salifodinae TaxID=1202767 RepID=A0A8T4GYS1_9EURY|nr:PKD domain-containing protein [Halolamina salifodinae]MBP1987412.1 hypothetical protein [Halolamina salifodinae]